MFVIFVKIFGQIDEKFIACILENKNNQGKDPLRFLVLFDQHAVHERIRTEQNLSGKTYVYSLLCFSFSVIFNKYSIDTLTY